MTPIYNDAEWHAVLGGDKFWRVKRTFRARLEWAKMPNGNICWYECADDAHELAAQLNAEALTA